jgi:hypothetical protein
MIMKKLLLAATLATSLLLPATVPAQSFSIEIGDRPYYHHGPRYWAGEYEMIWVPGHRSGHHWVHGHYVRGEHRRNHRDYRHHDSYDRRDDRRDDYRDDRRDDR